jgi:hypothetical protein
LPQQSASVEQEVPVFFVQVLQKPVLQMPVQHWAPLEHGCVVGVQAVTHCWPVQTDVEPQLWQTAPLLPHAELEVPATQVPFWQHPLGQVSGPHGSGAQLPLLQDVPAPQLMHAAARRPQAASYTPG